MYIDRYIDRWRSGELVGLGIAFLSIDTYIDRWRISWTRYRGFKHICNLCALHRMFIMREFYKRICFRRRDSDSQRDHVGKLMITT
jgi:hypothetical protein